MSIIIKANRMETKSQIALHALFLYTAKGVQRHAILGPKQIITGSCKTCVYTGCALFSVARFVHTILQHKADKI